MRRFYRIYADFTFPVGGILTSLARDVNFPHERCKLPERGMLTSLPVKMYIPPESALFLPGKEYFSKVGRLFSVYLSRTYFCIPLSMKKILIFVRVFPPAPANGWKYAILRTREMQSVRDGLLVVSLKTVDLRQKTISMKWI